VYATIPSQFAAKWSGSLIAESRDQFCRNVQLGKLSQGVRVRLVVLAIMAQVACDWRDKVILTSDNPRIEDPQAIVAEMEVGVSLFCFLLISRYGQ
jgi:hypothetical protein